MEPVLQAIQSLLQPLDFAAQDLDLLLRAELSQLLELFEVGGGRLELPAEHLGAVIVVDVDVDVGIENHPLFVQTVHVLEAQLHLAGVFSGFPGDPLDIDFDLPGIRPFEDKDPLFSFRRTRFDFGHLAIGALEDHDFAGADMLFGHGLAAAVHTLDDDAL